MQTGVEYRDPFWRVHKPGRSYKVPSPSRKVWQVPYARAVPATRRPVGLMGWKIIMMKSAAPTLSCNRTQVNPHPREPYSPGGCLRLRDWNLPSKSYTPPSLSLSSGLFIPPIDLPL